jgi:hypothetical protein
MTKCYFCETDATTSEHVPPRAFFASETFKEKHLIKVPSCKKHNNNKTNDDEFFRDIISMSIEGDQRIQYGLFIRSIRSIKDYPEKARRLLENAKTIQFRGFSTGMVEIEPEKIQNYFNMMAFGLYFYEKNEKPCDNFSIVPLSFIPYDSQHNLLRKWDYYLSRDCPKKGYYPKSFYYQIMNDEDRFVGIRMVFMQGIIILAFLKQLLGDGK